MGNNNRCNESGAAAFSDLITGEKLLVSSLWNLRFAFGRATLKREAAKRIWFCNRKPFVVGERIPKDNSLLQTPYKKKTACQTKWAMSDLRDKISFATDLNQIEMPSKKRCFFCDMSALWHLQTWVLLFWGFQAKVDVTIFKPNEWHLWGQCGRSGSIRMRSVFQKPLLNIFKESLVLPRLTILFNFSLYFVQKCYVRFSRVIGVLII